MSEVNELADKLKSEGEKFHAIFAGLTDEQWQAKVYTEDQVWTIRNVLAHFVTSERGLVRLFERIRTRGEGSPDDFSIDRYNAAQQRKTKDLSPQELLEQYKAVRADSVAWTLSLEESELEKEGRHPFLEMTTLREMIKMLYLHNLIHYRDMKKVLK
ncbi:MAG TPA: maleylpyruvate isomerase N-terminal domain-containing protein [Anaerolineales bacterium]|nr:maleylpyruvate isomerase N-terminal domain-containing protein [Anaerolineales bacterium]